MTAAPVPCDDARLELAAWALEGGELPRRLEEHCASCGDCAAMRDEYLAVVALLPFAAPPAEPPPGARGRLRARLSGQGQAVSARRTAWAWPASIAAALVLALAAGLTGFIIGREDGGERGEAAPVEGEQRSLQAAPGFEGAGANVVLNETTGAAMLNAWGLPQLAPGEVYQFWFLRLDGTRLNAFTFRADSEGRATHVVALPPDFATVRGVWVTKEPGAGSDTPRGPNVLITWWK